MSSQYADSQKWEVTNHSCPTIDVGSVASLLDKPNNANRTVLQ